VGGVERKSHKRADTKKLVVLGKSKRDQKRPENDTESKKNRGQTSRSGGTNSQTKIGKTKKKEKKRRPNKNGRLPSPGTIQNLSY